MNLLTFCLLALPFLVVSTPSPWHITIEASKDEVQSLLLANEAATQYSAAIPTFNDERIKDHPDKKLLRRIRAFFKTFTTGDFDGMRDLQSESYTMTNIRTLTQLGDPLNSRREQTLITMLHRLWRRTSYPRGMVPGQQGPDWARPQYARRRDQPLWQLRARPTLDARAHQSHGARR